ncbi:MAG: 2-phosphosulfolactate phosphatase [bacterium]|nr:2-phosphosulfolactate phosphatase [bacterium]
MNIETRQLVSGAAGAKGIVVLIDVLRACTTVPILFHNGATEIVPVETPEEAVPYEKQGYIPVGEAEHGFDHQVFHHNNSPTEVLPVNFSGKKIVLRSNNTTPAIYLAKDASDIVLGSFVNVGAIVKYIRDHHLDVVSLVALGRLGGPGIEDDLCARVITHELRGEAYDYDAIVREVIDCPTAVLVRDKLNRPDDVTMAVALDSYPIVPRVIRNEDQLLIRAVS